MEGLLQKTRPDARKKDGGWQGIVHYKVDGKWQQKTEQGYSRRADALNWAKEKEIEMWENAKLGIRVDDKTTVKQLMDLHIEHSKRLGFAKKTITSKKNTKNFLEPIHDLKVTELTQYTIEAFFLDMRKKTGNSYQAYLRAFRAALNFAVNKLKIIRVNPCGDFKLEPPEDTRIKFISEELYEKILDKAKPEYKLPIEVAYNTGMRISEILGITIYSLSTPGYIRVYAQYQEEYEEFADPKSDNGFRNVPISYNLYDRLKRHSVDIEGRLFYDIKYANLYNYLKKYNVTPHSFRHTYATRLVDSNKISYNRIAQIIGDNLETVLNTYVNKNSDLELEEAEIIRNLF